MAKSWCDAFLPQVAMLLQDRLNVRDRMHHLKTYKKCFVASQAIDFMVQNQIVESRKEAVILGQELQRKLDLWHHVCNEHDFNDSYLFFRFSSDDEVEDEDEEDNSCYNERVYTDEEISDIADDLKVCLDVQDRTYRFKTYKKCFVASAAIDLMVQNEMADSREEAVLLGRYLRQELNLFNHVCDDHVFQDRYFFFRFSFDDKSIDIRKKKGREKVSSMTKISAPLSFLSGNVSQTLSYYDDDENPVYAEDN